MDLAQDTWERIGATVEPVGRRVFVRTFPIDKFYKNLIELPPSVSSFYSGFANQCTLRVQVIAVGERATRYAKVGDFCMLSRLHFARYERFLDDDTACGWADADQLLAIEDAE